MFSNIKLSKFVKGVLIDIDDTLYSYLDVHEIAINKCYKKFLKDGFSHLNLLTFKDKYREKRNEITKRLFSQGSCRSRLLAFQLIFEELNTPQSFNKALDYETLYWNTIINNMKINKDAFDFLKRCKDKHLPICAVSDMQSRFQIKKLQKLKVDHMIDYLVTSEEVGEEKPSKKIFEIALNKINLKPSEVIMIGDNDKKDILGAKRLGIKTFKIKL